MGVVNEVCVSEVARWDLIITNTKTKYKNRKLYIYEKRGQLILKHLLGYNNPFRN
jgi:hypothetical protein